VNGATPLERSGVNVFAAAGDCFNAFATVFNDGGEKQLMDRHRRAASWRLPRSVIQENVSWNSMDLKNSDETRTLHVLKL
jgi:hypothetical protein